MNEQPNKIRVVCFIFNLEAGGAERVLLNIIRNIDRRRFTPVLYLLSKKGSLLPLVPEDTEIISLDDVHVPEIVGLWFYFFFKRIREQLQGIRPHIILSFMWYPNAIAIIVKWLMRGNVKVIVSERTSTSIYSSKKDNSLRDFIIKFLYPRADMIISPSVGIAKDIISKSVSTHKVKVIHNPADIVMIQEKALEHLDHPWYHGRKNVITAVGRLGSEKGFYYLIKAAAILNNSAVDFKLVIVGEGRERKNLENFIHELQLDDKVELVGFQQNPYKFLSHSTIFVLSSLYEGFPNVLLEALALGIPSVATRCPTGPEEIITDGVNGILVPTADEHALAGAIKKILDDEDLRRRLGEEGRKRAEDFRVEKIVKQYQEAIESICAESAER